MRSDSLLSNIASIVDGSCRVHPMDKSHAILEEVIEWLEEQNNVEIVTASEVIEWLRKEIS